MALKPIEVFALAKGYTDESIAGGGISAGKNCTIDSITDITGGHRVTFKWTLDNGTVKTQSMDIMDGADGQDGQDGQDGSDGVSPTITVTEITGGHRLTITDAEQTQTVDVLDGSDGAPGAKGDKGDPGDNAQATTMPTASSENVGQVLQYVGESTGSYTKGYFYVCTEDSGSYSWVQKNVQPGGSGGGAVDSVNGKTGEVTLTASDVGALPDDTELFSGDYDDLTNKPTLFSGSYNDLTNKPTLGTAAALDVATSGNASSSQVVKGDDTRLTDSRTPTSHTHTKSEITDFPTIPTKVSDLTNDSGFITKAVNDLTNYYLKSETYTQAEVDALIAAITTLDIEVVQSLPTTNISTTTIYLVPKATAGTQNVYDEYICLDTTTTPATWEKIGNTEIDLTNYVQKSQTAGLLKNDGTVDQTAYATSSDLADYQPKTLATSIVVNGETKTTVEGALQTFRNNSLNHKGWSATTVDDIYWTVTLSTPNNNCRGALLFSDKGGNVYSVAIMDNSTPIVTKVTRGIAAAGIEEIRCTEKASNGVTLEVKSKTWDKCMVEFIGAGSNGQTSTLTTATQSTSTAFDTAAVLKKYDITDQPIRAAMSVTQNGVKYINVSLESSSADSFFGDLYLQDRVGNLYIIALNGTKDNASVVTATKLNGNRNSVLDKQITGIKVGSISTTALSLELKLAAWTTVNAWFVPNVGFDNGKCTLTITDREASTQYDAATALTINTVTTDADWDDILAPWNGTYDTYWVSTDFDLITTPGAYPIYNWIKDTDPAQARNNCPLGVADQGVLLVYNGFESTSQKTQICISQRYTGKTYIRSYNNSAWSAWKQIAYTSDIPDITGKADKVSSPTSGNFAALDSNGNLTDSGHKHSDYDISGKADKISSPTADNLVAMDANGNIKDSGVNVSSSFSSMGRTTITTSANDAYPSNNSMALYYIANSGGDKNLPTDNQSGINYYICTFRQSRNIFQVAYGLSSPSSFPMSEMFMYKRRGYIDSESSLSTTWGEWEKMARDFGIPENDYTTDGVYKLYSQVMNSGHLVQYYWVLET